MLIGKDNGKQLPKVATMPPPAKHRHSDVPHPAVAEHLARFSDMARELDQLRGDNTKLLNDLDVERRHCHDLQNMLGRETERADYFQRYAVEAKTSLEHIKAAATTAHERALDVANHKQERIEAPAVTDDIGNQVDAEIAAIAQKFAPKQEPQGQ